MTPEEFNIACFEKMGWVRIPHQYQESWRRGAQFWSQPVPNFHGHSNVDPAMQLVEEAKKKGFKCTLEETGNEDTGFSWCCSFMARPGFGHGFGGPVESAPTMSAAICAAFLKLPV